MLRRIVKRVSQVGLVLFALSACGGNRPAQPIAISTPKDAELTCDQITTEVTNNEFKIIQLQSEMNEAAQKRSRNTFFGGLIGYATSEDGSAAQAEINAYATRNVMLKTMAHDKKCGY